jgi:hypothetical protein
MNRIGTRLAMAVMALTAVSGAAELPIRAPRREPDPEPKPAEREQYGRRPKIRNTPNPWKEHGPAKRHRRV